MSLCDELMSIFTPPLVSQSLGYVLVLGHSSSVISCSEDVDLFGDRQMTLVHVNGVFEHYVKFCKCSNASSEHEQLFIHRLFPSTFD